MMFRPSDPRSQHLVIITQLINTLPSHHRVFDTRFDNCALPTSPIWLTVTAASLRAPTKWSYISATGLVS